MLTTGDIEDILRLGHETRGFEVKGPGSPADLPFLVKVVRASLSMANLRDGGHVVIGIDDSDLAAMLPGLNSNDMEAWLEIALVSGCCRSSVDRAFQFFERTMAEHPDHLEFNASTAPIDRKRAAAGFLYAKPHTFDVKNAARAIFAYATLPGAKVNSGLWKAAAEGEKHENLLYEARTYLWNGRP